MDFLIGLDIGTTHIKAIALDDDGQLLAHAGRENQSSSPLPGQMEQDPEAIFQNVCAVLREAYEKSQTNGKSRLRGVSFSSAMHSLLATDEAGQPLTQAWLWSDLRATVLAERLRRDPHWQGFYHETGTPLHPMSPAVKLAWLSENDPALLRRARKFLGIKEFLFQKIFGKAICDRSVASATGLMHTRTGQWHAPVLEAIGLRESQLPFLVENIDVKILGKEQTSWLHLPEGTPFVVGASDGALANLGSEAVGPETLAVTIGTSAAVRVCLPEAYFEKQGRTFCYRLDGQNFIVGGASNNGGNVLDWLSKSLFSNELRRTPDLLALAETVPPGADGLLFLPYVFGERAPLWEPAAKPTFVGENARHSAAHRVRAALEGVIFNLRLIAEMLPKPDQIRRIHASGGFVRSRFWVQVLADVFGLPVRIPADDLVDASARGAVMVGRKALKKSDLPPVVFAETINPNMGNKARYDEIFARFKRHVFGHLPM
ncbi:MAG: gluconokinase [Saprospiraceae bacterium]